jgi:ribosomal protein L11 methyltransferase
LSIASIKLGMEKAIAIDIDDDSIENAKEYFRINGVNKDIKLIKGNISEIEEEGFDIICANIIRSVIEDNISEIHKKLKSGGKLFISGVLSDEEEKITGMLGSNGFEIKQINYKSEWIGLYAAKI